MKKVVTFLIVAILFLSCKDNTHYTMKTYYLETNSDGFSAILIRDQSLTAKTDTMAYKKANSAFASIKGNSNDKNKIPLKFELYNNNDQLIVFNFWEARKIGALQK